MPLTDIDGRRLGDSVADKLGNRNLIINGAMLVAQRGTSSTTSGYGTVDRFTHEHGGTDEAPTFAQVDVSSSDTPYSLGFRKALKATNGDQTSGAGAADYIGIGHRIEAQNIANSGWNYTSSSSYITLTFWARSSVAKSFKGYFKTDDGTAQIYPFDTGTLSANTWTKVTKTIPGNSNITINNDTGLGLELFVYQFLGTNYTDSSVTENAWAAYASGTRTPDDDSSWYTTDEATFEITGVQLEVGNTATPFEHRSYGDELARCQRYYEVIDNEWKYDGNIGGSAVTAGYMTYFKATKRANSATVVVSSQSGSNCGNVAGTTVKGKDGVSVRFEWQTTGVVSRSKAYILTVESEL
jgi:hypothetical protein